MNGRCLWAGMEVGGGGGGSSQARDVGAVDGSHRGWFVALQRRELQGKGGRESLGRQAVSTHWGLLSVRQPPAYGQSIRTL